MSAAPLCRRTQRCSCQAARAQLVNTSALSSRGLRLNVEPLGVRLETGHACLDAPNVTELESAYADHKGQGC
jgi:hypothetical protein